MQRPHIFLLLLFIYVELSSIVATSHRRRHRKQAVDVGVTSNPNLNNGRSGNLNSNQAPSNIAWPGSDNKVPYLSQWGAWTQQQIQQGSGVRQDLSGIQLYPGQAQWYPNSPEYSEGRPDPRGQPNWQQGGQQTGQQGGQQTGQQGGQQNWQQQGVQPFPENPRQTVIYWPPPNSTVVPAVTWSTWTEVKQQGAIGGLMSQWQNWYMNPDVWAQWQEWLVLQQRIKGDYPNGPDGKAINFNQTLPDDTFRILVDLLAGFVGGTYPRRVAMYNAKTYYPQYRRDYWIGLRYYPLDPQSVIESYFTCIYSMPSDINVLYEIDNTRIKEIVFQCVKRQETCCNLNCCDMKGNPLYYASWLSNRGYRPLLSLSCLSVLLLLYYTVFFVM